MLTESAQERIHPVSYSVWVVLITFSLCDWLYKKGTSSWDPWSPSFLILIRRWTQLIVQSSGIACHQGMCQINSFQFWNLSIRLSEAQTVPTMLLHPISPQEVVFSKVVLRPSHRFLNLEIKVSMVIILFPCMNGGIGSCSGSKLFRLAYVVDVLLLNEGVSISW